MSEFDHSATEALFTHFFLPPPVQQFGGLFRLLYSATRDRSSESHMTRNRQDQCTVVVVWYQHNHHWFCMRPMRKEYDHHYSGDVIALVSYWSDPKFEWMYNCKVTCKALYWEADVQKQVTRSYDEKLAFQVRRPKKLWWEAGLPETAKNHHRNMLKEQSKKPVNCRTIIIMEKKWTYQQA